MMSKVGKYSGMAMIVRRGEERSRLYFSMRRPQTLVVLSRPVVNVHGDEDAIDVRAHFLGALGSDVAEAGVAAGGVKLFGPKMRHKALKGIRRMDRYQHPKILELEYECKKRGRFLSHLNSSRMGAKFPNRAKEE